jgi:hypothetical protein
MEREKPRTDLHQSEADLTPKQGEVSLLKSQNQGTRRLRMPQKLLVLCLIVICVTLIAVIWITRDSLCELRVRQGTTEIAAILSCLKQR